MKPTARMLASRILAQQGQHLSQVLNTAQQLIDAPLNDSPAWADLRHITVHRQKGDLLGLRWWIHRACILNAKALDRHRRALLLIVNGEEVLPLPSMVLARSIYEAVIHTCWLLDGEVPTEQRLARWAGRLLYDSQEPPNALDKFGASIAAQAERSDAAAARTLGQKLMTRAGFDLQAKGGDRHTETARVTYQGASSTLTPNVTEFVDRFTPNQGVLWSLFSGAVHTHGWLVGGLEGDETELITAILSPLLDTSDALVVEVSRYFMLDPRPTVQRTHTQRAALVRLARDRGGPLLGVDGYRLAGGAPPLPSFP